MLSICLISFLVCVPLFSYVFTPLIFSRITALILIYSALLQWNMHYIHEVGSGLALYSGLFQQTSMTNLIETFLYVIGAIILIGFQPVSSNTKLDSSNPPVNEYALIILFTCIGQALLISSEDMLSMYLSIELQSFGVYILCAIYRNNEYATMQAVKYFLLGGLSSAIILLGTGLIYMDLGLTQFESITCLLSIESGHFPVVLGLILIQVGFIFKVAAAPMHNWAPDVYDGVPTVVTTWLITMPKISILVFICEILYIIDIFNHVLLISSIISLIIGSVIGLSQSRIKRLLAYSTVINVGFIFLGLLINTEQSIESFLFYLIQYTISNACIFIAILGLTYQIRNGSKASGDLDFISELNGQFQSNPFVAFSLSICLFSIAGVPPLIGFFAKQIVLYSSIQIGYYFISIVAIICSTISASYYLQLVKSLYFESPKPLILDNPNIKQMNNISNVHSLVISILTVMITFYVIDQEILLNSCRLLATQMFYYLWRLS